MSMHHRDAPGPASLDRLLSVCRLSSKPPTITYVDAIDPIGLDLPPSRAESRCFRWRKRRAWKRAANSSVQRKSFSARARRQRRVELAALDALPIVRRARAAGLHGATLRAYMSAVVAVDGPLALFE